MGFEMIDQSILLQPISTYRIFHILNSIIINQILSTGI